MVAKPMVAWPFPCITALVVLELENCVGCFEPKTNDVSRVTSFI
jgi:hypothetical protein